MLWASSEWSLLLVMLLVFLLVVESSFRIGRAHASRGHPLKDHVVTLQAAILGLLGLLLGFSLAMSVSRFDTRKELVLAEANAIGTTYLRAQLLPETHRQNLTALLREYVQVRLAFFDAGIDPTQLAEANRSTARLQNQLWTELAAVVNQDTRSVPTGLLVESMNEVIDLHEKRLRAMENHVPAVVLYLLVAVGGVALGFVGFASGLARQRRFRSTAIVALTIAVLIAVIIDLDRPRRGLIQVSQDSMTRLKETLGRTQP